MRSRMRGASFLHFMYIDVYICFTTSTKQTTKPHFSNLSHVEEFGDDFMHECAALSDITKKEVAGLHRRCVENRSRKWKKGSFRSVNESVGASNLVGER